MTPESRSADSFGKIQSHYEKLQEPDWKEVAKIPSSLLGDFCDSEKEIVTTLREVECKANFAVDRVLESNKRERMLDMRLQRIERIIELLTSGKALIIGFIAFLAAFAEVIKFVYEAFKWVHK